MPPNSTMPKSCIALTDFAKQCGTDVSEMLHRASMGKLVIGIRDFGEAHLKPPAIGMEPPDDFHGDIMQCQYVGVLTLEKADIEKLAIYGEALIEAAYLHRQWCVETVLLDKVRKVNLNDVVVPLGETEKYNVQLNDELELTETPVSKQGKETFQKQIAGLAVVLAKGNSGFKWGVNKNNSAIAKAVLSAFNGIDKDVFEELKLKGLSPGSIRQNISKGLELLGLNVKEKEK